MQHTRARGAAAGLLVVLSIVRSLPAWAGAADFEFQPVNPEIRNGAGSELSVRLVDKRTGKPVSGAIIFRTRLDMSPDNMGGMLAEHAPLTSDEPGVYRFRADLTMAGGWAFKLQAKVQGERETIEGTVIFSAKNERREP